MSQSQRPTRALVWSSATARFAATVDLPTPPLPLATAMTCLMPGSRIASTPAPAPAGGAWMSIKTFAFCTPRNSAQNFSASFLIVAGMFGSFVASASCTFTSPLSILTDLTRPNETMSRLKPGYFTALSAFFFIVALPLPAASALLAMPVRTWLTPEPLKANGRSDIRDRRSDRRAQYRGRADVADLVLISAATAV